MSDAERGFWGAHPSPPSRCTAGQRHTPHQRLEPARRPIAGPSIPPVGMGSRGSPGGAGGPVAGGTAHPRLAALWRGRERCRERCRMEPSPALPPPPWRSALRGRDVLFAAAAGTRRLGTAPAAGKAAALPWRRRALAAAGQSWVAEEGVKEPGGHADTFFGF